MTITTKLQALQALLIVSNYLRERVKNPLTELEVLESLENLSELIKSFDS